MKYISVVIRVQNGQLPDAAGNLSALYVHNNAHKIQLSKRNNNNNIIVFLLSIDKYITIYANLNEYINKISVYLNLYFI